MARHRSRAYQVAQALRRTGGVVGEEMLRNAKKWCSLETHTTKGHVVSLRTLYTKESALQEHSALDTLLHDIFSPPPRPPVEGPPQPYRYVAAYGHPQTPTLPVRGQVVAQTGTLRLGSATIGCAVVDVEGEIYRVLRSSEFQNVLGIQGPIHKSRIGQKGDCCYDTEKNHTIPLPPFLSAQNLFAFIDYSDIPYLAPLSYRTGTGTLVECYRAELLPAAFFAYVEAKWAGVLSPQQRPIAERCERLLSALVLVGIIPLVDEATGYQKIRPKDDLRRMWAAMGNGAGDGQRPRGGLRRVKH